VLFANRRLLHPTPPSGTLLDSPLEVQAPLAVRRQFGYFEVSPVVKIRLKRFGRKNHAFWRINAVDHRAPRDGKVLEELGFYDPINKDTAKQVVVNKSRVEHWLKQGAQPSPTVKQLLTRATDSANPVPPAETAAA
jgi:small subunit ribosomal protein S16